MPTTRHYSPSSFAFSLPPFIMYVIWEKKVIFLINNSAKFQLYQYAQDIQNIMLSLTDHTNWLDSQIVLSFNVVYLLFVA